VTTKTRRNTKKKNILAPNTLAPKPGLKMDPKMVREAKLVLKLALVPALNKKRKKRKKKENKKEIKEEKKEIKEEKKEEKKDKEKAEKKIDGLSGNGVKKAAGAFNKNFEKRFFLFKGTKLHFYKKQADAQSDKGKSKSVELKGSTLVDNGKDKKGQYHIFIVKVADKKVKPAERVIGFPEAESAKWKSALEAIAGVAKSAPSKAIEKDDGKKATKDDLGKKGGDKDTKKVEKEKEEVKKLEKAEVKAEKKIKEEEESGSDEGSGSGSEGSGTGSEENSEEEKKKRSRRKRRKR